MAVGEIDSAPITGDTPTTLTDRERLLELLKTLSYERKDVVLASGRKSDFYVDVRNTALHPEGVVLCGQELLRVLRADGPEFDAVAGPCIGADPLVSAVAYTSHLQGTSVPAMMVRKRAKTHGKGQRLEATRNVPHGSRVAVVEDVLTTGGSALKCIAAVSEAGYVPCRLIAVVDRQEGGQEHIIRETGLRVDVLYKKEDFPSGDAG
jgi:orotate phosphoribosyltransferase